MTASSTDAYNNNNAQLGKDLPLFTNYPVVSVSTEHNNFWPADVSSTSTSPSSEHNWEVDEEEAIKRRIYELKRQFHNGRFLIVRHLPRDATEEDVRELLNGHFVHSIQLQPSSASARVLLAEPEVLENWAKSSQHNVRGNKVTISPSSTEGLLCVARLPQDYREDEFSATMAALGEVNYCFLMRSEKTGESKGYGFVEYINKDIALQAKAALDGRELRDQVLVCDWLDPSHVTFASLHSTCLYVDRLPKDYRDMGEFRRIFSKIANPPYCQIAMKQGALQDWGLVEFNSAEDGEETRNSLNCYKVRGQPIRVDYYIPGVRAINIYMKMINDQSSKKREALLPEPPTNKVFVQLKNLTKHNPAFAKSLQNIILTQIQNLQPKGVSPPLGENGATLLRPDVSSLPHMIRLPRAVPIRTPPPINPYMQRIAQPPPPCPLPPPPALAPHPDESLNTNAQAALLILLAAQLQQKRGASNILSNPQVLRLLQTLVSQGDPTQSATQQPRHLTTPPLSGSSSNVSLSSSLKANFRNGYFKNGPSRLLKGPLLPTPEVSNPTSWSPEESLELDGNFSPLLDGLFNEQKEVGNSVNLSSSISTLLSSAQNLQQLLGSLNPDSGVLTSMPPPPISSMAPPLTVSTSPITSLSVPPPALLASPPNIFDPNVQHDQLLSMLMRATDPSRPETYLTPIDPVAHAPPPYLFAASVSTRGAPHVATTWAPTALPPPQPIFQPAPPVFSAPATPLHPPLYSPVYIASHSMAQPHPMVSSHHTSMAPPLTVTGFSTPVGQKRKSSHFLPSPESSPENGYIGQHSQGIGGHYPDSYANKKKKH